MRRFAVLLGLLACAGPAAAQQYSYVPLKRQGAGTHDFPTWERDVDSSEITPLPTARQGTFEGAMAIELSGMPLGVAAGPDGRFVAATATGSVAILDPDGSLAGTHELGAALSLPPASVPSGVLLAGPELLALVRAGEIAWKAALPAAPLELRATGDAVAVRLEGGGVEVRDPSTGAVTAQARVEGASAGPAWRPGVLFVGTSEGEVVGLDATSGAELWRTQVAARIDSIGADPDAVFAAGFGRSARSRKDEGPILMRVDCGDDGRRKGKLGWRRRVGGACPVPPMMLGDNAGFPSWDGYFYAVERRRGVDGWRTDLPSRLHHAPGLSGGRLHFAVPLSRWLVALSAENGAVMGWAALEDEDETFVGPAATASGLTLATTALGRVVGVQWKWEETATEAREAEQARREAEADRR